MSCDEIQNRLLDLPVDSFHELEAHLVHCPGCRAVVDEIRAGEEAIGLMLDDFSVDRGMDDAWAIAQMESAAPAPEPLFWLPPWTAHGVVAALAAAAVLAVTVIPEAREAVQKQADQVARFVMPDPPVELPPAVPPDVEDEPDEAVPASQPKRGVRPALPEHRDLGFDVPALEDTAAELALETVPTERVADRELRCDDLIALESGAMRGHLAYAEIACLQTRLAASERQTDRDAVSRVLLANSWNKGDRRSWARQARHHLDEIDRSDPDLAYKYALHLSRDDARAMGAIHYSEVALENRHLWSGETYVDRVYGIYKLRALSAQALWNTAAERHDKEQSSASEEQRDDMRTMTKVHALEWQEYAEAAQRDLTRAHQLCVAAAETESYCELTGE